jgi:hypothetical protein
MLDILGENGNVDLYLDNDATGEKCTSDFIRLAQLFRYCREKGLPTEWDLAALKVGRDKIGKLLSYLEISASEASEIWETQADVYDQRSHYEDFEDINAFLIDRIQE